MFNELLIPFLTLISVFHISAKLQTSQSFWISMFYPQHQHLRKFLAAAAAKSLQSCPTLCNPRDGSPPGSANPGILQVRTLEWVAISFSNAWKWKVSEVAQSCPTLSDSMGCSLPGSSVHGIFQARALEWGAIAFSGWTVYSWRFISRGKNKVSV